MDRLLAPGVLEGLAERARPWAKQGKTAAYIPALSEADPEVFSAALFTVDGLSRTAGDRPAAFTLQSVSKVFMLAYVLEQKGEERLFSKVGMEPTGEPFHSLENLQFDAYAMPPNPLVNAGALAVTGLAEGKDLEEKWALFQAFVRRLAGKEIAFNREVAESEYEHAFLNRSFCYFLKQHGIIEGDVEELIALYSRQCALEMDCLLLARIGAVFAGSGRDPETGKGLISEKTARICRALMASCGMYNASGEFAVKAGVPAKSGVSGCIMAVIPGRLGIGVYSPGLDEKGNSLGGWKFLELLNQEYRIGIY